ncbi:MAG: carbohydrate kinase family protein [Roseiflexaceae bacterium]|jgi:ribokinase
MLIIIGDINVDINLALSHWPHEGGDAVAHTATWSSGGTGLNSALAVARMGGTPQLWGRVGTDAAALQLRNTATHHHINIDAIQTDTVLPTGLCVIPVSPNGERTFLSYRGANTAWQVPQVWPDGHHWLHICGHALVSDIQRLSAIQALQMAQADGWQTSIDLCEALAPHLDVLYEAIGQLTVLTGNNDEMRVAQQHAQHPMNTYAQTVITKRGAQGCEAMTLTNHITSTGFVVDAIDTTACGDTFASVCVWTLMQNHELADALVVANAAGAITASRRGAADITPTRAEVITLIQQQRAQVPDWL